MSAQRQALLKLRTALLLTALSLLYLVGAWHTGAVHWDGLAPTAYRYVTPPPGYTNPGPPSGAKQTVVFWNGVSQSVQVYTVDLQAQLTVPNGAFPPNATGSSIVVTITPQAPPTVSGLVLDGNAYVVLAQYLDGTSVPTPWPKPVFVYLLFPASNIPQGMYTLQGSQATEISKTVDFPTQSVQGQISAAGTVVAAGPPQAGSTAGVAGSHVTTIAVVVAGVGVILVAIGLLLVARRRAGRASDDSDTGEERDPDEELPPA
jgi:hypothetical protein